MNASTGTTPSAPTPYAVHEDTDRTTVQPVPPTTGAAGPRTVRVRVAAMIATGTFVLGVGASMLAGPLLGGPPAGGPGGGPGGDPGTSQGTTQGTGQATQGTAQTGS